MNNNELRKYIKAEIEKATDWKAQFTRACDIKKIPYITFDYVILLTEDGGKYIIELTVDAWDTGKPFDVIEAIDKLDKHFKCHKGKTDEFLVQIYHGPNRGFVEDEDKNIQRLQRKYDVIVFEKGE